METTTIYYPEISIPEGLSPEQLEMIRVLQDTVQFYGEDPEGRRSVVEVEEDGGDLVCRYLTDDGKRCAISRLCTMEQSKILHEYEGKSISFIMNDVDSLKLELTSSFLHQIQRLHDLKDNWHTEKGLTKEGKQKYLEIINNVLAGKFNYIED